MRPFTQVALGGPSAEPVHPRGVESASPNTITAHHGSRRGPAIHCRPALSSISSYQFYRAALSCQAQSFFRTSSPGPLSAGTITPYRKKGTPHLPVTVTVHSLRPNARNAGAMATRRPIEANPSAPKASTLPIRPPRCRLADRAPEELPALGDPGLAPRCNARGRLGEDPGLPHVHQTNSGPW